MSIDIFENIENSKSENEYLIIHCESGSHYLFLGENFVEVEKVRESCKEEKDEKEKKEIIYEGKKYFSNTPKLLI